jgi:hypothetical protein
MICKSDAAYAGQGDTRLGPGAHWCLRCYRSEVLIEVATIDVLAALARPFQGYRASSPACLRLSSARKSLVCAPLTEGERTDADASCWRRDDRVFDLVEVECTIPSSRSTSSRHCFMAPGKLWSLEGVVTTPWLPTTPPEMPLMEFGTFALPCVAARRAQQD